MEFVRNMERRRLIKPQDILATLQSIPEDESESELQEHVFDSDSDEDFIPQNISSESEDSEGTNPEDIPSTSTGDRAHAVMLPCDHPPGRGQKKSAKRPRNERTTDNDGGEGNATTNTREGESEGILVSADGIQWKPVEIGEHLPGRRDSQNILREAPGPTGYARRNIIIDSPLSAWRLFFDSYILTHIKNSYSIVLVFTVPRANQQVLLTVPSPLVHVFFLTLEIPPHQVSSNHIGLKDWTIQVENQSVKFISRYLCNGNEK
ncbi:uncharacterized protein [Phyllobates terribilis]|uniref:uncharacterized protein n=1 Tax=Phyllobates terribilis TaxID=111132 RepID=UPI003CCAC31B